MEDKRSAPSDASRGPNPGADQPLADFDEEFPDELDITASAQGDGSSAPAEATPADDLEADAEALGDERLEQLTAELEQQKDKYVRLLAEFDNFRRRSVRDRQDAEHRGMGNLLRGILDTLDDLSRFAQVDPKTTDAKTVVEGTSMVERKLLKSLAGHGLEVVDPAGHAFDPALHEAISTAPAPSKEEDHVVAQTFQVGYVFNGTLLRPARVVVQQWNG